MDDAALRLRIRVIVVSTRAAVHSLGSDDPQVAEVVERGKWLLEGLAEQVDYGSSDGVRAVIDQAREELASLNAGAE
jgi:hypothetical protein